MRIEDDKYFCVQRDKYQKRAEKFLAIGRTAIPITSVLVIATPVLGSLALPLLATSCAISYGLVAGYVANKIAEDRTDVYESQSMRERFVSRLKSIREKAFGPNEEEADDLKPSSNDLKLNGLFKK